MKNLCPIVAIVLSLATPAWSEITCISQAYVVVDEQGQLSEGPAPSLYLNKSFTVDEETGRHNLFGIGNQMHDRVEIVTNSVGASGLTIFSLWYPGNDSTGRLIQDVQLLSISAPENGPRRFILTEGASFILSGTCE